MVAPIGSAASSATAAASARPQVQSRRVSLKLGPLGISYASDELVWGEGQAEGSDSTSVSGVASSSSVSGSSSAPSQQVEQQTSTRSFDQELFNAWRAQVGERADAQATYGRDGALKTGARASGEGQGGSAGESASDVAGPGRSVDSTQPVDSTQSAESTQAAASSQAASATTPSAATTAATTTTGAPSSRMRSAIAAYLACARDLAGPGSMLTAVA